ncbi:HNH endonuclease [Metabacillus herbersteinensis]|uniref:HNH endonuclease n=1 Tax=Metabacillus herbersteinensis TaxID=283816 RepID=A0ABV6GCQ3_9BACI
MSYRDDSITELPKYEDVKHEMLPLKGFSNYAIHPYLGKIYNKKSNKWMLVNASGVGDRGYLLTKLKQDSGKVVSVYEHEAVYAAVWGDEPKSWRKYGVKLEIDHRDKNVKNNNIENLSLGTSSDNKKNRSYDIIKNPLTFENAEIVREEFEKWIGSKIVFYEMMAGRFNVGKRTIQNYLLGIHYKVNTNEG